MDVAIRRGVVPARISLADLLSTTIEPTVGDAVAIIVQLAQSPQTGRPIRARLDASHVWLHADGTVTLSPGLLPPLQEVAALLGTLLGRVATASGMPRGLVTILEAAARHNAAFTIPSLSAFAAALAPFQPPEPAAVVRALVAKLDDVPIFVVSHAADLIPEPEPLPPPFPDLLLQPEPRQTPLPARPPAPASPAVAGTPEVPARSWRPSTRQVTSAIAATLVAALLGGAIGRWRHGGASRIDGWEVGAEASCSTAPP